MKKDEVKHIAKLANLVLSSQEIQKFQKQLSETISYVDKLIKLDNKKVLPTSQVTGLTNVFREDIVLSSFSQKEALANAKNKENGFFLTKAIFKNES